MIILSNFKILYAVNFKTHEKNIIENYIYSIRITNLIFLISKNFPITKIRFPY